MVTYELSILTTGCPAEHGTPHRIYKRGHNRSAAQRPMTAPTLLYSVPCQRGTARRRADDINCCIATDDGPCTAVLSFPFVLFLH